MKIFYLNNVSTPHVVLLPPLDSHTYCQWCHGSLGPQGPMSWFINITHTRIYFHNEKDAVAFLLRWS